jgi:DNA-binding MurR/RpiR family transcriptional regulator
MPNAGSQDHPSIATRIGRTRPTLTRSHQQMADYVLAHPLQAATMPIDELAAAVGVSIATANRFARAIGLDGYPMLRSELVRGFEAMLAPIEKMRVKLETPRSIHDVFVAALEDSQRNIAASREALDRTACEATVTAILGARRIYLAGYGASGWLAGLLQRSLDIHCDNVHLLAGMAGASYAARLLPRMGESDLLIAISYPRYVSDTVRLAQSAHQRGIPVLALTDGPRSPLVPHAQVCLFSPTEQYAANSESSALAMIEALGNAVAHQAQDTLKTAARMTEAVMPWLHESSSNRLNADAAPSGSNSI